MSPGRSSASRTKGGAPAGVPAPRPLAVTFGDPAGIGPDITLKAWSERKSRGLPPFVLIADPRVIDARARRLGLTVPIAEVSAMADGAQRFTRQLPVWPVHCANRVIEGRSDPANARATIGAIERAVAETAAGRAAAVVTNPIAKSTLLAAGFRHPGHTEFLGELARRHHPGEPAVPVMMLASDSLRVVPLTVHVPLARVPALVSEARLREVVVITAAALVRDFGVVRPRIAVAGLNPHAGEQGALGREELDIIVPALARLKEEHAALELAGPLSADSMFHPAARARYDAALTMYHDQALIPIKTIAFDSAVNVTLGLPFVRTSPDHGTAFDIAGTGAASPGSFVAAIQMAAGMARLRGTDGSAGGLTGKT